MGKNASAVMYIVQYGIFSFLQGKILQNQDWLYCRKFSQVKFSWQVSCAVWTHLLAAPTVAGWPKEKVGPPDLVAVFENTAVPTCCRSTAMVE